MKTNATTIYDVAERAGVSTGTVSNVVNHVDGVSPATARLVREAMAALGYDPPPPGRRRGYRRPDRVRRTGRLALVIPGMSRSVLHAPVYMDVQNGIEQAVRKHGQTLVFSHIPHGDPLPAHLVPKKVDGVILFGNPDDPQLPRGLRKLPMVRVMGLRDPLAGYDHVTYDNAMIGDLAGNYLASCGHRHCGFIGGLAVGSLFGERGAKFQECIERHGGTVVPESAEDIAIVTEQKHQVNRKCICDLLDRLLAHTPQPTALFFPADMLTNAAYPLLYERGVVPGRDIDIVSCNNEELLLANLHPRPAVVDIHAETVGYKAVEQLIRRIDNPKSRRAEILIAPELL